MEMPTWSFLVIAIIMAVVIGRAGTLLRNILTELILAKLRDRGCKGHRSVNNLIG